MKQQTNNIIWNFLIHPITVMVILGISIMAIFVKTWYYFKAMKYLESTNKETLINMQDVNGKNNAIQSKSSDYSDNLKNQITISIDDLALSTYGNNYLKIIDDMDHLFTMKMLENLLVIDYSDDEQMMKRVNRIGRISEAKKSLIEVKDMVHNFAT